MLELFRCKQIHFAGDAQSTPPWWNVNDPSIQCFAGKQYWLYAGFALIMIVLYVLGWPAMCFIFLKNLHEQHAVVGLDAAVRPLLSPPPLENSILPSILSRVEPHSQASVTKAQVKRDGVFSEIEQKADRRDLVGGEPEIFTNAFTSDPRCLCFGFPTLEICALDVRGPV